jgi:DNA repair protein RecO (recombination protein O)
MGQYKTEAILLAVRDWDYADRMVTLFSREYGKVTAIAYGARRPRSRFAGAVQPFVHADVELTSGKTVESLRTCDIKHSYRELRENLDNMAYAAFLAELAGELWPEREAEPAAFDLLLLAFGVMGSRNPRLTALACALQMLVLAGFRPEFSQCVVCGQPLSFPAYFDSHAGGSVCAGCTKPHYWEFSQEVHQFMERLLQLDWREPGHFSVVGSVLLQTERLLADFITYRLDKPLKSMSFIAAVT